MKKLTILLLVIMFISLGIRGFIETQKEPETIQEFHSGVPNTNRGLENYAKVKVRGATVKELFSKVESWNISQVFPIPLRYGDVLPDSYEWNEYTKATPNLSSGDLIRETTYYEIVVQDQLGNDGYLDTIIIRAYDYKK